MGDEAVSTSAAPLKKKRDEKYRRRDPRSWDNLKKTLQGISEDELLERISKSYNELYNENRTLSTTLHAREKQLLVMKKEIDKDQSELTKSIMARGQLENLCRELQKQNKLMKEENVARIKEDREVANTFTERLNALTNLITESKDKVKEENQNMTDKLTDLYEQYQQRESHLETVTKQLELQKKLGETQMKKIEIEHEAERQTFLAQKKALEMQLVHSEREVVLLQEKNKSLEAQVELFKSQYSDFETTITESNKVFDKFKEEMSRMSKQLTTLESERNDLRKRWQSSVKSLISLSEQHMALSKEQSALEKRMAMLQKLCRQLQEDRSAFLKQLKEHNIEPVVPSQKNSDKENDTQEKGVEVSKTPTEDWQNLTPENPCPSSSLDKEEMERQSSNSSDEEPKKRFKKDVANTKAGETSSEGAEDSSNEQGPSNATAAQHSTPEVVIMEPTTTPPANVSSDILLESTSSLENSSAGSDITDSSYNSEPPETLGYLQNEVIVIHSTSSEDTNHSDETVHFPNNHVDPNEELDGYEGSNSVVDPNEELDGHEGPNDVVDPNQELDGYEDPNNDQVNPNEELDSYEDELI